MPVVSSSAPAVSDACLVAAARRGDQHALTVLLQRYDPKLLAIVGALRLPNGVETHDVLQAARLGLARAIATWQPGGAPFCAFAKLCARRRAISAIDQARTARRRVLAYPDIPVPRGRSPRGLPANPPACEPTGVHNSSTSPGPGADEVSGVAPDSS